MTALRHTRCHLHPEREAAARCPGCRRHFCRECVTEHAGALYCLACLEALAAPTPAAARRGWVAALVLLAFAILLQWGLFLAFLRPLANLTPPAANPAVTEAAP